MEGPHRWHGDYFDALYICVKTGRAVTSVSGLGFVVESKVVVAHVKLLASKIEKLEEFIAGFAFM